MTTPEASQLILLERFRKGTAAIDGGTEPGDESASSAIDYGKTAGFLSIGVGLTGIITYAYFLIASHVLSATDYGQIAVVWSAIFITVSTLYRPIEQLLSRHVSERLSLGQTTREPMKVAAKIQLALAAAFAVVALILRGPIQNDLLEGNVTLYWVFFLTVLGYAASYFARGYLAGMRRFGLFSLLIISESIFRTTFAVVVAIGLFSGQSVVAMGMIAAPCLSLIVVPLAFARQGDRGETSDADSPGLATPVETEEKHGSTEQSLAAAEEALAAAEEADAAAPEFSLAHGTGFAASVLVVMFSEQVFLNAGPLLIRSTAGAAAAGYIFNVLMIARAPLQLFQAVSTSLLPHLTRLHHESDESSGDEFHSSIRMVMLGVAAFTAVTAIVVLIAGPKLMQVAFSDKFTYDRPGLILVTIGMGLYLCAVTVNQACVAQGQVRRVSARWIGCAIFFVGWCLLTVIGDAALRIEIGFALTAAILLGLLALVYTRPHERIEDIPDFGPSEGPATRPIGTDEGT